MILCCTTCGNSFWSEVENEKCTYCFNDTEVLVCDNELKTMSENDVDSIIKVLKEKYKNDNPKYDSGLWNTREDKDNTILLHDKNNKFNSSILTHKITTGYNFDGYDIIEYLSVISGNVVIGTGVFSEVAASISDFFGTTSTLFENKMEKSKEIAVKKLIAKSAELGGNAIIGIDFDFFTLGNNMLAVSANGTSVTIQSVKNVTI